MGDEQDRRAKAVVDAFEKCLELIENKEQDDSTGDYSLDRISEIALEGIKSSNVPKYVSLLFTVLTELYDTSYANAVEDTKMLK